MNFLIICTISFVCLVTYSTGQPPCVGRPSAPTCGAPGNEGQPGAGCEPRDVWYYDADTRQCRYLRYLGCGGNNNRWCTQAACQQRCIPANR